MLETRMMAGVEGQQKIGRKQKNKSKKEMRAKEQVAKQSRRSEIDATVDSMFDIVESDKRDLGEMTTLIGKLSELRSDLGKGEALTGDWKLAFVNTADAMHEFGTGLGKLPGTSILDLFVSFSKGGKVTVTEVCRVLGPFPNLRNELRGAWSYAEPTGTGGFKDAGAEAKQGLTVSYSSMQDGRDKVTDASTGFKVRSVNLDVKFCDDVVLVATLPDGGELVFESEPEMQKELGVLLRKDLTKEGEQLSGTAGAVVDPLGTLAQIATGAKKPWDLFK